MSEPLPPISDEQVARLADRLEREAEAGGYHLNPDRQFTLELVAGLLENERRYGYPSCPCRLAEGNQPADLDIVCPCDYRDADLTEHDACYCALYVAGKIARGEEPAAPIPERRPPKNLRALPAPAAGVPLRAPLPLPVWHCRVCGYLCARESPPETCPICKAKKDRFQRFW